MIDTIDKVKSREVAPPRDLRESLGEPILLKLALDAVLALEPTKLEHVSQGCPRFRPQMMLSLLAYCYASGIFDSAGIVAAIQNDATVRYICARTYPDRNAIRYFRRHHRALIEQCLAYIFLKSWLLQSEFPEVGMARDSFSTNEVRCQFVAAANSRVDVAIIMDGVDND